MIPWLLCAAPFPALALARIRGGLVGNRPCPGGTRTEVLYRDRDGTLRVGCGSNAVAHGLHLSEDGGDAWLAARVDRREALHEFQLSSVSRARGGGLYPGGFSASTRGVGLQLRTVATAFPVEAALVGINQVGHQFPVATYHELADGRAIAESLIGVGLLHRPSAGTGSSASDWTRVQALGSQILDLVAHDASCCGTGCVTQPDRCPLRRFPLPCPSAGK